MLQGVLRFQKMGVCNSTQDFRSATVSPFSRAASRRRQSAVTQWFFTWTLFWDGQLIRPYHSAHGQVDGLPQVRGVYHHLEEE